MKVFKFGGASVATVERIRNLGNILNQSKGEKILVVVSAIGKTTNALEKVVDAFYTGNNQTALELFDSIKKNHKEIYTELLNHAPTELSDFFTEIEWLLHDKPVKSYDYYYDQVVCVGELLSSSIVSVYLNNTGYKNTWVDVRDIIRTDDNFRDARIDWEVTEDKINNQVIPLFKNTDLVITQGFIGATDENESTTLGREGSDFSAAIFANLLNAEHLTIWKDVKGVMNADPKLYQKAEWIKELNYKEVIEMAYYGAQIIHPKTIKPLQNKGIPLYVRSFIDPQSEGTCIHNNKVTSLPPMIVYKENQVVVQLNSRDFSFVGEGLTSEIYRIFETTKLKPNLTQNGAISLLCVLDDHPDKLEQFALAAAEYFDVQIKKGLQLLTIRHYSEASKKELIDEERILLKQETPEIIQVLLKE